MHPKDGITTHPQYSKIDERERKRAQIVAKKVLERVEQLRGEVTNDYIETVRAGVPSCISDTSLLTRSCLCLCLGQIHQERRKKAEQAAIQAQAEAEAAKVAAAEAEAAVAAATAAAQTASLDSLRGLVGPANDAMNQPRAPAAAPSSMYSGLADVRPPAPIDIPPPARPQLRHPEPEPEPEPQPQHMINGSPPSYPGPVPVPAAATSGQQQTFSYQLPPGQAPGYQPPPAHPPGYQPPPADPSWGSRPLPPAIGSLTPQQQSRSGAGGGPGGASAPPAASVDVGSYGGSRPQQPAGPFQPGAPEPPGARTLGDATARGGYQSNLPPLPWEVPRAGGINQYQPPAEQLAPPPAYGTGRPPPPMSDKERAWHAASSVAAQPRAPAPSSANWQQQQISAPSPAPVPSSSRGGGSGSGGRSGRPTRVIKVYGDGHCMYRSVACHLNPDIAALARNEFGIIIAQSERPIEEAAAISLRNRVASYMESHWDEFPTVLQEER